MNHIKLVLKYLIALIVTPQERWQMLAANNQQPESRENHVFTEYYLYLMGYVGILVFLSVGFYAKEPVWVATAMRSVVTFLASFFLGPYVAHFALSWIIPLAWGIEHTKERMMVFIYYAMSFQMVALLFTEMFRASLFNLVYIYLFYIVWSAAVPYLGIPSRRRTSFTIITSSVLFLSHWLIATVMGLFGN